MTFKLSAYFYNLGLAQTLNRHISEAILNLKKSIYWHPENQHAWNLLGLCYYRTGRIPMAKYCWKKSLELCNSADSSPFNSQPKEAARLNFAAFPNAAYYLEGLENDENAAASGLAKAVELVDMGEYKAALGCLKESDTSVHQSSQLLSYMGILEYLSKNKKQARKDWLLAAQLDKADIRPLSYLKYSENRAGNLLSRLKAVLPAIFKRRKEG